VDDVRTHGAIYDDQTPVRHGYTVADVSRMAWAAIRSAAQRGAHDLDEKRSIAIAAIIEELHAHECDPGGNVLMHAGERAMENATQRNWANWGYNSKTKQFQAGFQPYWRPGAGTPLDEAVAERIAVHQILATLTDRQQEVVRTLVAVGDRRAAAAQLGIDPTTVSAILGNARRAFSVLWHEHETPRPIDYRAGRSNPYSPEAAAARPEIARRAVRVREERRAAIREAMA
jgi:hypothetical protein